MSSCSHDDGDAASTGVVASGDVPISFGINGVDESADASNVNTRGGRSGIIDTEYLKTTGFGVYAYYTGTSTWEAAGATTPPNFMYNESMTWGIAGADSKGSPEYGYVYTPVKYWPNDNNPADNATAIGSQTHSYLSFFAYAPYVGNDNGTMTSPAVEDPETETGIIGETANTANGAPKITYRWTNDRDNLVDILWANSTDRYKTMASGDGKVKGKVNLTFKHGLANFRIKAERIYDETTDTQRHPDNDVDTKILVSSLTLDFAGGLKNEGKLSLADGTWSDLAGTLGTTELSLGEDDMVEALRGTTTLPTTDLNKEKIADIELDKWTTTQGVTETPQDLVLASKQLTMLPQEVTFTPTIKYSYITRDDALELDYLEDSGTGADRTKHRYSRIVNTVTAASPVTMTMLGGKSYTLLVKIGVEHVSFEVVGVEDWDFPVRFDVPVAVPGYTADDATAITVNE